MSELPPGFVLEPQQPTLPEGFVMAGAPQSTPQKKPFGLGDTWPARLAKGVYDSAVSAATLPGDVYAGKAEVPSSDNGGQNIGRVLDMATMASPVNPAVRAGDQAIPGAMKSLVQSKVRVPTAKELEDAGGFGFNYAREMGVDYSGDAVKNLGQTAQAALEKDGIFAELAPKTFSLVGRLQDGPPGAVASLSNIHAARQALNRAAGDVTNKQEAMAANRVIAQLDDFIAKADPASVVAGPAAPAANVFQDALGNFAAAKRSESVTGREDLAHLRAKVSNSGQNLDNSLRQRFVDIASEGKAARGFSDEEIAQATRIAEGDRLTNSARMMGNLLGGGGGLGMAATSGLAATAGGFAGGVPGAAMAAAAAPILGASAKKMANALTARQVDKLDEMTRMRSPLYQQALAGTPMEGLDPARKAAMIRMLMSSPQDK